MSNLPLFEISVSNPTLKTLSVASLICTAALFLSSCAGNGSAELEIWRQIPIQMARVTQTDSYTQTYILDVPDNSGKKKSIVEKNQQLDDRMDEIFNGLIGTRNWQHLKNLYGVSSIREELIDEEIHMEGLVNFTAYLDPLNHRYVIMEGSGRFFAVRDKTGEILLSGDYHIAPQRYKIEDFQSGCIPMETTIYTTRIPGKPTYYKGTVIQYDLLIHIDKEDNDTFAVDYQREHFGYIDLNGDEKYDETELFASLKLKNRYHHAKLLDISGLSFVKKTYEISDTSRAQAGKAAEKDRQRSCVKDKSKES